MSKIIAVSNQKGGVSKTTVSYNLGACMALNHGKRVLLIDADPQANLSKYLGYEPDRSPTMTQLVMTACMNGAISSEITESAVRHCEKANVDYIPSDLNLASCEILMTSALSRETVLKRILSENVTDGYDFVIIDCLPSLGTMLINALTSADKVLIPVQTQEFSMDGLQALESLIQQIKTTINPKLELLGILPTMVDRTKISKYCIEILHEKYGGILFRTSISRAIEAANSAKNKIPLCLSTGKLSAEYENLTQEVIERC
ncbi:MAG: ParA family protein [Ruminococcus sp.]|nr:ParA family protein [Ruminococcus sp.]